MLGLGNLWVLNEKQERLRFLQGDIGASCSLAHWKVSQIDLLHRIDLLTIIDLLL